jgi:hypothetical protein
VWRLELGVKAILPGFQAQSPEKETHIALLLGYPSGDRLQRVIVAAVDSRSADNAPAIAAAGFAQGNLDADRSRLHDAAQVLCNVEELKKEADDIAVNIAALADLYYAILDGITKSEAEDKGLSSETSLPLKGELCGWKFAVTYRRFDPWRTAPATFAPRALQESSDDDVEPIETPNRAVEVPEETRPRLNKRPSREQARRQGKASESAGTPKAPEPSDADLPDDTGAVSQEASPEADV